MNKGITALLGFIMLISCLQRLTAQQLPLYSQYMFNTLEINPAYAGFRNSIHFTSMFRKEFNGIDNSPQTALISMDMPIGETKLGVGVKIADDRFSVTRTFGAQSSLSYMIQTGDNSQLRMGLQVGALNYKANLTQLVVTNPGDPVFQQDLNTLVANFGTGVFFSTEQFYAGISIPNLVRANLRETNIALPSTDVKQNMHLYVNAGFLVYLNDNFILKPSVLLRGVEGIPLNYDVNANVFFRDDFSVGMSYRSKSAIVGIVDFKILPQLRAGYAYDYNVSRLNTFSKGAHEIILRYHIPFWKDEPLPSYLF